MNMSISIKQRATILIFTGAAETQKRAGLKPADSNTTDQFHRVGHRIKKSLQMIQTHKKPTKRHL